MIAASIAALQTTSAAGEYLVLDSISERPVQDVEEIPQTESRNHAHRYHADGCFLIGQGVIGPHGGIRP